MHRSQAMKILQRQVLSQKLRTEMSQKVATTWPQKTSCDVFINHRSVDTKRSISSLLYDHLRWLGIRAFLDNKNMKPGDKLFEQINGGIMSCKVGVLVFSPTYCQSYFCLHELALMMESKKKVIPIFCDVKPSQLRVVDNGSCSQTELQRFNSALEEARYTVGIAFDSSKGYDQCQFCVPTMQFELKVMTCLIYIAPYIYDQIIRMQS